jgi:GTP pyrophosphokinase
MKRYAITEMDELYATISYGGISLSKILPKLRDEYNKYKQVEQPKAVIVPKKRKAINGIIVENIDNCLVRLAGCCVPLPGDDIIGFITRGYGVSVHKTDCLNVLNASKERIVKVYWEGALSEYFAATLYIAAIGRIDLVADITTSLAAMRIVMHSISSQETGDGLTRIYVTIDVHSLAHLETVAKKLRKITNVIEVTRSTKG